ncbi:MAG: helix-turn-helix transcriptional regulator [Lachnospiraceae bacterium]|nr:helix-turn-helix transcriptional regulator [Lachnospiraceae bacterium]
MEGEKREWQINAMIDNLPVLRAKLDLSQKELGKRIGVTRQQIANYENRKRTLTWTSFLALISVFSNDPKTGKMLKMLDIWDGKEGDEKVADEDLAVATGGISQMAGTVDFEMEYIVVMSTADMHSLIQDELRKRGVPEAVIARLPGLEGHGDSGNGGKLRIIWKEGAPAPVCIKIIG